MDGEAAVFGGGGAGGEAVADFFLEHDVAVGEVGAGGGDAVEEGGGDVVGEVADETGGGGG